MQDRSFGWVCGGLVSALLTVGGCADRGDFGFVEDAGPAWLAPEDIGPDGLLLDRLEIVLAADASAKDLDRALDAVGGEVGASSAGRPWMVVTVPSGADADAMEALADTLAAQPGVAYAGTAWLVSPEVVPLEPVPLAAPSGIGASANFALGDHRFFAAWNASRLAKAKVPVYVVDAFATHDAVDQLSAMRFVGPDAARRVALPAPSDRNHGHWVASLIGADFDPVPPLGTHPDPTATLDLVGIDYGSVGGALDTLVEMDKQLPREGFFVLSTSFGFSASVPEATRRIAAIAWREAVLSRQTRFLHLTSSGNEGILDPAVTTSGSAFALQARVVDLDRDAAGTVIDGVEDAWEQAMERQPALRRVAGRTLVVGASDGNGLESSFSNRGADLRMIGRGLTGVCVERGEGCVEVGGRRLVTQNGTSGATPLAAGLAAWAHAIDPSLTADTLADRLLDHDDGRWVDALSLTLSLETPALPVREAMLDVLGDGTFDEQDLEAFLALFDTPDEALDQPPLWSAADLNGDGRARTNTALPVDLDGDGRLTQLSLEVPSADAGPRTVRLDERDVTDLDFLCWGAYAGPFRGDTAARDARLGPLCETREAVLELTGINARSFSMIRVDPAFTGQTESEASFDDERVEGRFLEWRDPEGDQPLHPEGGFSRTRGVDSFVFGTVPCNPASGTCLGPSTAFDGDADSSVVWTCTRDLVSQPTVCQFLTASSARAVVGPGTSPNGAANRVLSQSFVSLVFLVREPVDYVIEIDDVQIERDGPEPLSVFGSAAEVELRTVYRRFDGDGAPFETGSPTGTLMPGEHVFSVTVSSGATPWFDTEVSASATHQGAITFTRR